MNKRAKIALLSAMTAVVAAQGVRAANDDIVLGFNGNGAGSDYIINLGNAITSVGVGGTAQANLSSDFSLTTFNSVFTAGANGTAMGAGGGTASLSGDNYFTLARSGGAGQPNVAGSTTPGNATGTQNSQRAGYFNTVINGYPSLATAGGSQVAPTTDTTSWTTKVTATSGSSMLAAQGINVTALISGSQVFEDLYQGVKSGTTWAYTYVGYLELDLTGSTPSLTFTPTAFVPVPEPATYGWIAGAGLLALCLRRQLKGKLA